MRRTKIVCTIGPSSLKREIIRELICAGMDVARINFSHGDVSFYREAFCLVREEAEFLGKSVAILGDLQGVKLRIGEVEKGATELEDGTLVELFPQEGVSTSTRIFVPYEHLLEDIRVGEDILLDDGLLRLRVKEKFPDRVRAKVLVGGILRSKKGVHFPHSETSARTFTEKDREDLRVAVELGVDYVAVSFVRDAEDLLCVRQWAKEEGLPLPPLVAKIERKEALKNLEEICQVADGIMVARGDLGVEVPIETVPVYQKTMTELAKGEGKIVIIATQMLESMRDHTSPTRAEATDVANAVLDGADALMLSAETAIGKYPVETTRMMQEIISATEKHLFWRIPAFYRPRGIFPEAVVSGALKAAQDIKASVIIVFTHSGFTASILSSLRPSIPLLAVTPSRETYTKLALLWGVIPGFLPGSWGEGSFRLLQEVELVLWRRGLAKKGDSVVFVASSPFLGYRNLVRLHRVGDPLGED